MIALMLVAAIGGLVLLAVRLRLPTQEGASSLSSWPRVSIVVPARNEEKVLSRLLESLGRLDYPDYEVIVVNDLSEDATAAVARRFPVTLVEGKPRPPGWGGKHWAAWQGAAQATGRYLLFSDADTFHHPHGLRITVAAAECEQAGLVTALPFHACESRWEQLLGPFQVMLLSATRPFGKPRPSQLFAIGQYLLFRRDAYEAIGGHESVRQEIVEDVPLAQRIVKNGLKLHVLPYKRLYDVQMYANPFAFVAGWRRNFRAGMKLSGPRVTVDIVLMIVAMSGAIHWEKPWSLALMILSAVAVACHQRTIGRFSPIGAILWPLGVGLFTWISLAALYDGLRRAPIIWKNRSYDPVPSTES